MPRRSTQYEEQVPHTNGELTNQLAAELSNPTASGQPIIEEQVFPTGKKRVTVIWDAWDHMRFENRTAIILRAYDIVEGREGRNAIALASGLTIPEARAAGMLTFRIIPALRPGDPVTLEQCSQAMIDEGASRLLGADNPLLVFPSRDEAEAARQRLSRRLPNSEQVWLITREVGSVEDGAELS
ncbi:MAG: hypothetical protein L0215_27735 [Gemmataceae bacterium]|nr:hypothetical protein [Gemmataceae bacterium]